MSANVQRAILLMGQNRHALAVDEIQKHLSESPNDAHAHAVLALCLSGAKQFKEASEQAAEAIRLEPDFAFAHYVAGHVFFDRNRFDEALVAAIEAIRLDPYDSDLFALKAQILLAESRHADALEAAEKGLELNAEDINCQNLRAMALKNLGRHNDAASALESALAKNPENPRTHANQGWALLEKNRHEEALQHFQEALRLDPTIDWARQGIVTALKSRYKVYAIFLKYFLWMSKLTSRQQWGVIIGVYMASRMVGVLAMGDSKLAPVAMVVRVLLFGFVVMTWIADPLFNLALRLNPYGRLALTEDQRKASTLLGTCFGLAGCFFLLGIFLPTRFELWIAAGMSLAMLIPTSTIYRCAAGPRRIFMTCYCAALSLLGGSATIALLLAPSKDATTKGPSTPFDVFVICIALFALGVVISQLLANFLIMRREKR